MRFIYAVFLFTISFGNLLSQNLNKNYMLFSNSKNKSEYIEFKNDSVLSRKPYFSNFGGNLSKNINANKLRKIYKEYKYKRDNDIIVIYLFENNKDVKYKITNNEYFESPERKEIYIKRNNFETVPAIAVTYNKKIYWLDKPKDSKNRKTHRELKRILKNKDTTNIEFKIYRAYEAFQKFGYQYVFGIIEIKERN